MTTINEFVANDENYQDRDRVIREDLTIGREIHLGGWPGVTISNGEDWYAKPLAFKVVTPKNPSIHVWRVAYLPGINEEIGWQVADLIDGRYQNHRGQFEGLRDTLNFVMNEEEK